MKGIILAGGLGTRLYPMTIAVNKQLLPVYDKPLIYYPLSTLMSSNIKDILIITDCKSQSQYISLFGDGRRLGLNIEYAIQESPNGIAESLIIGKSFIGNDNVALILGDNIFHSSSIFQAIQNYSVRNCGSLIFTYSVKDPTRYGIIDVDSSENIIGIVEKPTNPTTNLAVVGLYIYDSGVVSIVNAITPSCRGELEITDVNNYYIKHDHCEIHSLKRGDVWLDAGTETSLLQASNYVQTIQERQGCVIGCIEEIALKMNLINLEDISKYLFEHQYDNNYIQYLRQLIS